MKLNLATFKYSFSFVRFCRIVRVRRRVKIVRDWFFIWFVSAVGVEICIGRLWERGSLLARSFL